MTCHIDIKYIYLLCGKSAIRRPTRLGKGGPEDLRPVFSLFVVAVSKGSIDLSCVDLFPLFPVEKSRDVKTGRKKRDEKRRKKYSVGVKEETRRKVSTRRARRESAQDGFP